MNGKLLCLSLLSTTTTTTKRDLFDFFLSFFKWSKVKLRVREVGFCPLQRSKVQLKSSFISLVQSRVHSTVYRVVRERSPRMQNGVADYCMYWSKPAWSEERPSLCTVHGRNWRSLSNAFDVNQRVSIGKVVCCWSPAKIVRVPFLVSQNTP